ncbi:hypothetical protein FHG87_011791 [Trinorchestia longiramus]|nr:hypothetical protein FHG87_011791 [Trinorchestia longiramus]
MWSGGCNWQNWAAQSQHLQSMSHDQVDWATLAKQWIQMKETTPTSTVAASCSAPTTCASITTFVTSANLAAPPPPPPPMSPSEESAIPPPPGTTSHDEMENSGEMDMEIEEENAASTVTTSAASVTSNVQQHQTMQPQMHNGSHYNDNWGWSSGAAGPHPPHQHNNWGWGAEAGVRGECWSVEGSTYPSEEYLWGDGGGGPHMAPITTDYEHGVRHGRVSSGGGRGRQEYGEH